MGPEDGAMEISDIMAGGKRGFLDGRFLVAMPGIDDGRFARAVILVAAHSDDGAIGFVVNHPSDLTIRDMFDRVGIEDEVPPGARAARTVRSASPDDAVMRGGPVEPNRGFVLHTPDYGSASTTPLDNTLSLTSTLDVLKAIARGRGPRHAMLALGYASWDAGQLEDEMRDNVWLTADPAMATMFDVPPSNRYDAALASLGVRVEALSGVAGNA